MSKEGKSGRLSASAAMGAVALAFLVIGYQAALFMHRAAALKIVADGGRPDTVYVVERIYVGDGEPASLGGGGSHGKTDSYVTRRSGNPSGKASAVRREYTARSYQSFAFNPNTVSVEDLMRLGFSRRQAESIENYRSKGGHFARKEDFAKSYVVSDSIYARLEPFIDIPLTDLNTADSAAFDALPGIGPYFASKMVSFRRSLGGYSYKEQLLDIYNFDRARYDAIADLVTVGRTRPFELWTLPADSLARHPYIDRHAARSIELFRENTPASGCSIEALAAAGILSWDTASKLSRCNIAPALDK